MMAIEVGVKVVPQSHSTIVLPSITLN